MQKLLFFCSLALAQTTTIVPVRDILCGSPTDQYFSGGVAWTMPQGAQPAFLRYGTSFGYNIPVPNGWYNVSLTLVEPNATVARQRQFTVTVNGQTTDSIDVFSLAGADNVAYTYSLQALAGAGYVKLQFQGVVGNAIVSEIIVTPMIVFPK
jgi:Malectin domain